MVEIPQQAQKFELDSVLDLIRLVVSNSGNRSGYLYYGMKENKTVFAVSHLVPSWYELRGLPVTMLAYTDTFPTSNIIAYKFASETDAEKWEYVENVKNDPNMVYIPLIKVKEFPNFFL